VSYLLFFLVGIPAGIVGGLLGTGGCVLMMPVIRFGFHFDPALAVGTSMASFIWIALVRTPARLSCWTSAQTSRPAGLTLTSSSGRKHRCAWYEQKDGGD